ncbi:MAG: autotransporter outer membrane beta-barrel domain-containing protein, partial [Planctomycetes bacterium]|nr:autotransporter outer membrane beta-barrel domain-containing protein [Planctomycetota bacterium]
PTPSPDLVDVLAPIGAIADPVAVVNAVAQLAPSTPSLAAPLVTFRGIRQFQNLWSSRLDMCREVSEPNKENPDCRDNEPRNGWWLKGFGYSGNQDAREGFTGYNARTLGTMIACDTPIGLDTRAGLGFGYARSTINGETFDASTEFDSYQAIAYIGHEDGPWFVNGSASFGWNEYSSMRHIEFPGVDRKATTKYSGQDYSAFVSTGFHLSAPQEFTITPLASLQYTRMHLDGYTERGAGDIDLKAKSQDYDFLESGLGVKVERYFSDRNGTSYVPEGHFNWFHELSNPELKQTAKYTAAGSGSFTTPGLKTADDMFNVGGGLTLLSCACSATTWSLEAVYDYDWNNDGYFANQVTVRLTSRF